MSARDTGAALVLPYANTGAMQKHLDEIGRAVASGAHALLLLDKAGWHTTSKLKPPVNVTPQPLRVVDPLRDLNVWMRICVNLFFGEEIESIASPINAKATFAARVQRFHRDWQTAS
jgi:hypothetical protein